MRKNKCGMIFFFAAVIIFLITGCQTQKENYLQIFSLKQDQILREFPVHEGDEFRLEYIHSSEKTPIYDFFEVNNSGSIILTEERFNWYAVGLESHSEFEEVEILLDGRQTRVILNRIFETLPIRVGWIANQIIFIQQEQLVLKDLAAPGDLLHISIVRK